MEFDSVEAKARLGELQELMSSQKGKTVSVKFLDDCYSKVRWLEMFLLRAREDEMTEMLERVHKRGDGSWDYELPKGEAITVRGRTRIVVFPEASNVLKVRALTHEEELGALGS